MVRQPARRSRAADEIADDEDEEDVLDVATAVALAAFQGLIAGGMDPETAVKQCWRFPVDFMVGRRAWWAAVQQAYGED
jgi:hypothetical protein